MDLPPQYWVVGGILAVAYYWLVRATWKGY